MNKTNHSEVAIKTFFPKLSKNRANSNPVFNLKVSESEKYEDDNAWFKNYMEFIVPSHASTIDDYKDMKLCYDVYHDNLEGYKDILDKYSNKFGENIGQIDDEVSAYPKLHNKVNKLKGEFLKRPQNIKAVLLSAKAIKDKNKQLVEAIKASVEESVALEISKVQLQMQGMEESEINKYIESLRTQQTPEDLLQKDFQSEWEIFYSQAIRYCNYDQDVKLKTVETVEDAIVADRFFIYSGWKYGKPHLEVRNPLYTGFLKASNEMFVHKSDYIYYKKPITVVDAYSEYGHLLSDDDMYRIGISTTSGNYAIDSRHSLDPQHSRPIRDNINEEIFSSAFGSPNIQEKVTGLHQGEGVARRTHKQNLIWETHFEFKAFRELIFLSYIDEYNLPVTLVLSNKFEIPKAAKKEKFINKWGQDSEKFIWFDELSGIEFTAERLWIPRKYEVIRLGNDVYPICREVPFQHTDIENPFSSFTLSTFGAIISSRNSRSVSLLQRAIPAYFDYILIKSIQRREITKYQGYIQSVDVDQIPLKLGQDIDGNILRDPIATWMLYRKHMGVDFYSGSQTSTGGLAPSTRSPGSSGYIIGTANEIYLLQQILQIIDQEIGIAMGISPQREASFSPNSNVTDNLQAISQSYDITEPYFFIINEVWKHAILDYIKNFRTYCQNEYDRLGEAPIFQYVLPDGTKELFKITPRMLQPQSIGIFVANSNQDASYSEIMLNYTQAFAQNAGEGMEAVSTLVKAITGGYSTEEIHKLIKIETSKQQQRQQEMEQLRLKVQEEYLQKQNEQAQKNQDFEIEKINLKGSIDKDLKEMDVAAKLATHEGSNDEIEYAKIASKERIEKEKIKANKAKTNK